MRKINAKSSNIDSFKYSLLILLHYYDISHHPERISKLKPFENKYNFNNITPNKFEINNPHILLTVFDENSNITYLPKNNSANKADMIKWNKHRYAAIKPLKNKFVKLKEIVDYFSYLELRDHILQKISKSKIDGIKLKAGKNN